MKVSVYWIIEFIVIYKYRSWFVQLLVITISGFCFESFFVHKLARTLKVNIAAGQLLFHIFVNRCWLTKIGYLIVQKHRKFTWKLSDNLLNVNDFLYEILRVYVINLKTINVEISTKIWSKIHITTFRMKYSEKRKRKEKLDMLCRW